MPIFQKSDVPDIMDKDIFHTKIHAICNGINRDSPRFITARRAVNQETKPPLSQQGVHSKPTDKSYDISHENPLPPRTAEKANRNKKRISSEPETLLGANRQSDRRKLSAGGAQEPGIGSESLSDRQPPSI
ncbi:hypothetical protein BO99DRAFT_434492 [Aspergillus violaceofuscus CBS 115571]|uniref:Uncharacterized protein n=1 Tax=Aspergillus violaceofuscus (strain CBS 115571) TaxID=1450538 RepID=A0A2V5H0J7_ASPV1|nr:hypothetical protein BO99DRAFT_434492 [Aspergillus violaceofuscus CBS 115571]